jgi:hypothetical protein
VIPQLNVFAVVMEHRILAECNGRLIIDLQFKCPDFVAL